MPLFKFKGYYEETVKGHMTNLNQKDFNKKLIFL